MSFPENWLGYFGKKIKIKENDFNKIKKCYENEFKINVYKLGDDKDIQKLYENIINYLS